MLTKILASLATVFIMLTGHAQNVGIGTAEPTEKLQVDSGNIKIGSTVWKPGSSNLLKFGDGSYCYIGEQGDDSMRIQANHIQLASFSGNTKLTLNGVLVVKDGTEGNGKVLVSNADGQASWQTISNNPSSNTGFSAAFTFGNQSIASGSYGKILFPYLEFADGTVWDNSLSEYTAPATGVYHFDARVLISQNIFDGLKTFIIAICVNNIPVSKISIYETYNSLSSYLPQFSLTGLLKCNASDKITVQLYQNTGVTQYIGSAGTAFSGYRVY
jgi:hypothetical protein